MRQHAYRFGALAILALGAAAALGAVQLGLGGLSAPGSGLWPFITALVIIFCGLVLVAEDTPDDYEEWTRRSGKVGLAFVALGVFIVILPILGVILSAVLLLTFWIHFLSREPWPLTVVLAVLGAVGLYLVFGQFLDVQFPIGVIGQQTGMEFGL
ncbi:tripartite tricarboxylate transporter TctB family protein [Ornithinimicrobium faecis]|uniref:Tripartite tricarboxylate transporter TctB family protein n=1 Tax=Ornithinimicrobium faecis TaxID=2934158 RepID=A0ABY4YX80_9MICO|nr:tripartite tricarboxylate transporter TctB family protein [Ornithinimicrobium sp. HY1793]USQ81386.1 tripartite tricarboxylate transporter TctB family protein [Ornithinimicrobium sp. HY1793]